MRIILHARDACQERYARIVVHIRDMDVLALLVAHDTGNNIWVSAGFAKEHWYVPVHRVKESLPPEVLSSILAFHCVTGCDTVSHFYGQGKKTA